MPQPQRQLAALKPRPADDAGTTATGGQQRLNVREQRLLLHLRRHRLLLRRVPERKLGMLFFPSQSTGAPGFGHQLTTRISKKF